MDRVIVITLLAFSAQAYATGMQESADAQLSTNELVDKLLSDDKMVDTLVDKFVNRAQDKLDQLDLELEDTLLAKDEAPARPPSARARAPPPRAPKKPFFDGLNEGIENLLNSGGGVTPTVTRSDLGGVKPNRGMSDYSGKDFGGAFGIKTPKFLKKTRALPTTQGFPRPAPVPRQSAFAGPRMRAPLETLAENDTPTTSAGSIMPSMLLMGAVMGMAATFVATSFRRGASMTDHDYKPM